MNCKQAQNLFDAYLDEELTGTLATEFGAHKLSCAVCRRELALLEVVGHVVASDTDMPQLDTAFGDRLLACATAQRAPVRRPFNWRLYLGAPLAAAACLAFASVALRSTQTPSHSAAPIRMVLPDVDTNGSPEAILKRVEEALVRDPDNPRLQELAKALSLTGEEFVSGTKGAANLLENLSKDAIMEILKSIPIDKTRDQEAEIPAATATSASGDEHEPAVEDL